jgi:hypothetical protein
MFGQQIEKVVVPDIEDLGQDAHAQGVRLAQVIVDMDAHRGLLRT